MLAVLAACAGPAPAELDACALVRKAELPLQVRSGVPIVSTAINGQPMTMLLDTGAEVTVLAVAAARRAGLARDAGGDIALAGVSGIMPAAGARARRVQLGDAALQDWPVVIGPIVLPSLDGQPLDGLLGATVLSEFDVDLDLPNERMTLYRARPCPSARPPWADAHSQVAMAGSGARRLLVPVRLDGVWASALLDTGTSVTMVSRAVAVAAGATEDDLLRAPTLVSASGAPGGYLSRVHRFRELRVGEDVRRGPVILVGEPPRGTDALLGGDYLTTRRIWLSFATGQVFVSRGLGQPRPR